MKQQFRTGSSPPRVDRGTTSRRWIGDGTVPLAGADAAALKRRCGITSSRRNPSSLSRVVLVLTLSMASREGHLAYRSQSDNPLQGTTLGGSPDDPRRQRTRNAASGHATRAGTRERQRGLPGAGDLAHPVLPVAPALRALWRRRRASAAAARAPWAPGAGAARDRTVGAQRGDQHSDLGLRADRGRTSRAAGG